MLNFDEVIWVNWLTIHGIHITKDYIGGPYVCPNDLFQAKNRENGGVTGAL
jgi:hypothetical protein